MLSTAPSPMPIDPVMAMERINLIKMQCARVLHKTNFGFMALE